MKQVVILSRLQVVVRTHNQVFRRACKEIRFFVMSASLHFFIKNRIVITPLKFNVMYQNNNGNN